MQGRKRYENCGGSCSVVTILSQESTPPINEHDSEEEISRGNINKAGDQVHINTAGVEHSGGKEIIEGLTRDEWIAVCNDRNKLPLYAELNQMFMKGSVVEWVAYHASVLETETDRNLKKMFYCI